MGHLDPNQKQLTQNKMKPATFFDTLRLQNPEITETLEIPSSKIKDASAKATAKALEKLLEQEVVFFLQPGADGPRLIEPIIGRTVTGRIVITHRYGCLTNPKITGMLSTGGALLSFEGNKFEITCRMAAKDSPPAMVEELATPGDVLDILGLVGGYTPSGYKGELLAVEIVQYGSGEEVSYRAFLETEDAQYSTYCNQAQSVDLKAQVGGLVEQIGSVLKVGTMSLGPATKESELTSEEWPIVADVLGIDVQKRQSKEGKPYDSYTLSTTIGRIYPDKRIKRDIKKLLKSQIGLQFVKQSPEAAAYLVPTQMESLLG